MLTPVKGAAGKAARHIRFSRECKTSGGGGRPRCFLHQNTPGSPACPQGRGSWGRMGTWCVLMQETPSPCDFCIPGCDVSIKAQRCSTCRDPAGETSSTSRFLGNVETSGGRKSLGVSCIKTPGSPAWPQGRSSLRTGASWVLPAPCGSSSLLCTGCCSSPAAAPAIPTLPAGCPDAGGLGPVQGGRRLLSHPEPLQDNSSFSRRALRPGISRVRWGPVRPREPALWSLQEILRLGVEQFSSRSEKGLCRHC